MSELPDEVRAAVKRQMSGLNAANVFVALNNLRADGLILWASELRDEATIERAAAAIDPRDIDYNPPYPVAESVLSALLEPR